MRAHVTFRVYGSNLADLQERAVKQLAAVSGLGPRRFDPMIADAVAWAMDVKPETVACGGMVSSWRGEVSAEL